VGQTLTSNLIVSVMKRFFLLACSAFPTISSVHQQRKQFVRPESFTRLFVVGVVFKRTLNANFNLD
jgi:hypothetical protein